jgi:hypothetical protein
MNDSYDLARDLNAVRRSLAADMPEAVIFYCGRALEATSAQAVTALALEPGAQVFANLDLLERLSCISRPALYLGHALRRLANDARHILRPLSKQDAEFAALCVGPWLQWYLEDFFRGPRTPIADENFGIPGATGHVGSVLSLLRKQHASGADISDALLALADESVAKIPALSSMIAESLISCGRVTESETVLNAAFAHAPDDLRLNQLYALALRRLGKPVEALALLKKLSGRYSEDEETIGITAGAMKAAADDAGAARLYAKGWQLSHERNLYLGVNAAALELWQGKSGSRDHAAHVADLFARRNGKLAASGIDVSGQRDYYDLVTEAEARLLSGDSAGARTLYTDAFTRFASRKGDIDGTRHQANRSIVLLGGDPLE